MAEPGKATDAAPGEKASAARSVGPPGDELSRICAALRALLGDEAGPSGQRTRTRARIGAELQERLVRGLQEGIRDIVGGLREELPAWRAAADQLGRLCTSRHFPCPEAARDLQHDLERAAADGQSVLDDLAGLIQGGGVRPAAKQRQPGVGVTGGEPAARAKGGPGPPRWDGTLPGSEGAAAAPPQPAPATTAAHTPRPRRAPALAVTAGTGAGRAPRPAAPVRPPPAKPPVPGPPGPHPADERTPAPVPGSDPARSQPPEIARTKPPHVKASAPTPTGPPQRGQLDVTCPRCAAAGRVRWDRLGHVFACRGCSRLFTVHGDGRLVEVTRTSQGRWMDAAVARKVGRSGRLARRCFPLLALFALIGTAAAVGLRPSAAPAVSELPHELEPRAEMLARAWLDKDLPLMRRLTSTTHDRTLYSWLVRHRPPAGAVQASAGLTLDARVVQRASHQAELVVLIRGLPGRSPGSPVEFRQAWVERAGQWYFLPPAR